jgi:hypothetical protein
LNLLNEVNKITLLRNASLDFWAFHMTSLPPVVTTIQDAVDGVLRYNDAVKHVPPDHPIVDTIRYARAWYAVRKPDGSFAFGPSKFIGYIGITAEIYAQYRGKGGGLDGRTTERALEAWAEPIELRHPLFADMKRALSAFCAKFGLTPSTASRLALLPTPAAEGSHPEEGDAEYVELIWRLVERMPRHARLEIGRRLKEGGRGAV